jgi:3,4-dihydroxy 2-butanone 4-phosphate synthase/GTP cyclohydrolase II
LGLDEWLAESFQRPVSSNRPSVTLSYAQSLDGSIALRKGDRLVLSGPESHKLTHQLRAQHDAILIGIGTVLSDDPQLNVRLTEGRDPQIVVLDSRLRTPLDAKMLNSGKPRVFCIASADRGKQEKLEQAGAMVERQTDKTAIQVNLSEMLGTLKASGINSVMVEGGGEVISNFLSEKVVDRVTITIAPKFVGGYKAVESAIGKIPELKNEGSAKFGKDIVFWGDVKYEAH